jgi:hypothetical protein
MSTHHNHFSDVKNVLDFVDENTEVIPVVVQDAIYRLCSELERYDRGMVIEYFTGNWPDMFPLAHEE